MLKFNLSKAVPIAMIAISLLSSCGNKKFQKLEYSSSATAGQYIYIKPKLDLVIFQDNSDSMANAMGEFKPQFNNFLSSLDANWEYRVVVLPLLSQQSLSSKWVVATDCSGVTGVGRCVGPAEIGAFNSMGGDSGWINSRDTTVGNRDQGFYNMNYNIENQLKATGFLRADATLAMVVLSNNDDQTNVTYVSRPDGSQGGVDYNSATTKNSFNAYKGYFQSIQGALKIKRFYSVVSTYGSNTWSCGGLSWQGRRYMDMASALGGTSFDLCAGGVSQVLADIQGSLKTVVQTVRFNYVVLPEEPNPESIKLTKNGASIANDSNNGWTYVGYLSNQPTSDSPVSGNIKSGFMIRLNGSAKFQGTDAISLDYTKK